jgi:hypothetical protein
MQSKKGNKTVFNKTGSGGVSINREILLTKRRHVMSKKTLFTASALVVAVFAFALGLSMVAPVQAGPDKCCTIPATPFCSEGIGVWYEMQYPHCQYNPQDTSCLIQLAPECW